jgi:N-acetylmuramoyl-L-alanine amidase
MAKISNIIIHCSDSEFGSASEIRRWHLKRGWSDIGYHFVILNGLLVPRTGYQQRLFLATMDGNIEAGRKIDGDYWVSENEQGAHTLGLNASSIGICLIGTNQFTVRQMNALKALVTELLIHYGLTPKAVLGHYETPKAGGKTCPNFDVKAWRTTL